MLRDQAALIIEVTLNAYVSELRRRVLVRRRGSALSAVEGPAVRPVADKTFPDPSHASQGLAVTSMTMLPVRTAAIGAKYLLAIASNMRFRPTLQFFRSVGHLVTCSYSFVGSSP
jgi:hypothetical protein